MRDTFWLGRRTTSELIFLFLANQIDLSWIELIFTKDIVVVAQVVLTLVHVILVLQEPIAKHVKNILY